MSRSTLFGVSGRRQSAQPPLYLSRCDSVRSGVTGGSCLKDGPLKKAPLKRAPLKKALLKTVPQRQVSQRGVPRQKALEGGDNALTWVDRLEQCGLKPAYC